MDIYGEETVNTIRDIQIHNYLHMLSISILYFDHLLTSATEINLLWMRPKRASAYWFFLNRYFAFFGNIVVSVLGFSNLPTNSCKSYNLFRQLLLIVNQVLVCVLLTLRIYALYGRSLRILGYMVGSGAILATVSCWSLFGQKSKPAEQGGGCHIGLSVNTAIHLARAWEALFVYDSIIFGFTLYKTWSARRDHSLTRIDIPLVSLLLRDGAMYFAVMALANLSNILTFYFCDPFLRGALSTFASSISVTMMSRLMLNLHENADIGIYSTQLMSTNVDCVDPASWESSNIVELDTIWSDGRDMTRTFSTMPTHRSGRTFLSIPEENLTDH